MAKITEQKKQGMFQEETPEERKISLESNAYAIESQLVKRAFNQDQISTFKDELSALSIEMKIKEEQLKAVSSPLKEEIRFIKEQVYEVVVKLKNRYEQNDETVYLFDKQEDRKMVICDKDGVIIAERPLMPHEKQLKTVALNQKTGTNQ